MHQLEAHSMSSLFNLLRRSIGSGARGSVAQLNDDMGPPASVAIKDYDCFMSMFTAFHKEVTSKVKGRDDGLPTLEDSPRLQLYMVALGHAILRACTRKPPGLIHSKDVSLFYVAILGSILDENFFLSGANGNNRNSSGSVSDVLLDAYTQFLGDGNKAYESVLDAAIAGIILSRSNVPRICRLGDADAIQLKSIPANSLAQILLDLIRNPAYARLNGWGGGLANAMESERLSWEVLSGIDGSSFGGGGSKFPPLLPMIFAGSRNRSSDGTREAVQRFSTYFDLGRMETLARAVMGDTGADVSGAGFTDPKSWDVDPSTGLYTYNNRDGAKIENEASGWRIAFPADVLGFGSVFARLPLDQMVSEVLFASFFRDCELPVIMFL